MFTSLSQIEIQLPYYINSSEQLYKANTELLDNLLILIDQMQSKTVFYQSQQPNNISQIIKTKTQAFLYENFINDEGYKLRQCFIMGLLFIQSSSEELKLKQFCQDRIVQMWGFEKDDRVKSILKNTQFLEIQKGLFASDMKSFSQRLKIDMEERLTKIDDLETRIHLEDDQQLRKNLQRELEVDHEEFEQYLNNINEMESKLDIGLQFLKDLKRSLVQLKSKIDSLQDNLNIIGDDVRKLRGKSYDELFNIRKRKVLQTQQLNSINQIYIPLKCQEWDPVSGNKIGDPSKLLQDGINDENGEINKFLQKDSKNKDVLLIRGVAGSGKSRVAIKIEEFLLLRQDLQISDWLPIYVSLPTIKEPKFNLIEQALESEFYQFDKIQIREFKEAVIQGKLKIILILDSYDEMKQDCIQANLYHTNRLSYDLIGNTSDLQYVKDQLKVIITTRTEILTSSSYQTWFYGNKLQTLQEIELLGFDNEQKQKYLEEYTILSLKRELLEFFNFIRQNFDQQLHHNKFLDFWQKAQSFLLQIQDTPKNRNDYLLNEKQAFQICQILKQEKFNAKISKDQLISLQKKLIDLWNINKFQKLINSAQIEHILTTPFLMEIVVQVLPSMTVKFSNFSGFQEQFVNNFVKFKKKEIKKLNLIQKCQTKKIKQLMPNTDILQTIDKTNLKLLANKIWEKLQNDRYLKKFSLIDKIDQNDLQNIDSANIVIRALIVKKLTVFDFYLTFVEYYHIQQIRKQLVLGRTFNQESLTIDLFNFSQSLALNMTLRQRTQIKNIQKGQLKLQFVENINEIEDWQDIYFNDFESNGEYKKLIRSCILLTQKGSNYSFAHKSIQEFFVGHFLLTILHDIELIDQKSLMDIVELFKWENKILQLKKQAEDKPEKNLKEFSLIQQDLNKVQKLCSYLSYSIFDKDQFNISTDNYKGVMSLIKDELKQLKKIKQKLLQIVKLSAIQNNDFIQASSNSMYLLGYNNELLRKEQFKNIQIQNTDLLGLSFYESNLEGSGFKNINISSCNFSKSNIQKANWSDIKCNELNSIIWKREVYSILYYKKGQFLMSFDREIVFSYDIKQGTYDILVKKEDIGLLDLASFEVSATILSQDESLLAIGWSKQGSSSKIYDYIIQLWEMNRRQTLYFLEKLNVFLVQIKFSADNQYLAARAITKQEINRKIFFWKLKDFQEPTLLQGHEKEVNCIEYAQNGTILCSASSDSTIILWKLQVQPIQLAVLKGHTDSVKAVVFHSDNIKLVSCSDDTTIRIWNVLTFECIGILKAHKEKIVSLQLQPDGQSLISISMDKTIMIWSIDLQKQVRCIEGSSDNQTSIVLSTSNGQLLAQQMGSQIKIWDLNVGKIITQFDGQSKLVINMAFQPGTDILTTISAHECEIKFWDTQTQKINPNFEGHGLKVQIIKFSQDSSMLVSWGQDLTLRVWDIKKGKLISKFNLNAIARDDIEFSTDLQYVLIKASIKYLEYDYKQYLPQKNKTKIFIYYFDSEKLFTIDDLQYTEQFITTQIVQQPNGQIIAWGIINDDRIPKIKLWKQNEEKVKLLQGHDTLIKEIRFITDGTILISLSIDNQIQVWYVDSCTSIIQFNKIDQIIYSLNNEIIGISFDQEPKKVVMYNIRKQSQLGIIENLRVEDLELGCYDLSQTTSVKDLQIGCYNIAQTTSEKTVIWSINDGKELKSFDLSKIGYSPNGEMLVQFGKNELLFLWETQKFNLLAKLEGHSAKVEGVIFSNDGKCLVSYSSDFTMLLWDSQEYSQKQIPRQHMNKIIKCVFSQNNQILASIDEDDKIYLWDIFRVSLISQLQGNTFYLFSPDSNLFAYVSYSVKTANQISENNQIVIWNIKENKQQSILVGEAAYIHGQCFTINNQQFIAACNESVLLWDIKTGYLLELIDTSSLRQQIKIIMSCNNKFIVSQSNDRAIQIWNTQSGLLQVQLIGHRHFVNCVAFSNDGSILASGSRDSTIILWETYDWQSIKTLEGHGNEASKDNTIRFWNMPDGQQIKIIKDINKIQEIKQIVFSQNEELFIWFNFNQKSIQIKNFKDESEIVIEIEDIIQNILYFQQQKSLLIFRSNEIIYFWDLFQGMKFSTKAHGSTITESYQFANNVFSGIFSNTPNKVLIWNFNKNTKFTLQEEHTNKINQIEFSPDDQILASCSDDGMIKLWDLSPLDQETQEEELTIQCYKTLALYQPITASQCLISGAVIKSKIGWNLKQLFIQKGAIEKEEQ